MCHGIHHRDGERFPTLWNLLSVFILLVVPVLGVLPNPGPPPRHARGLRRLPDAPPAAPEVPPSRCVPGVAPDYNAFVALHTEHRATWLLSYREESDKPYQAGNRIDPSIALAATTLEALARALASFPTPDYVRPYIDCVRTD
ncbi:hypothetical protein [Nocardiopsis potens]|uniref:hypothetical protein n=1 Tax=Nocardiopsis potens TaxID=1246458 RepID=UPI00034D6EE5|nr:hypothetical protein [Nocardiopsis potens]